MKFMPKMMGVAAETRDPCLTVYIYPALFGRAVDSFM